MSFSQLGSTLNFSRQAFISDKRPEIMAVWKSKNKSNRMYAPALKIRKALCGT